MTKKINIHKLINKNIYLEIKKYAGKKKPFKEEGVTRFLAIQEYKWMNFYEINHNSERLNGNDFIISFTQDNKVFLAFYQAKKIDYCFEMAKFTGFNRKFSRVRNLGKNVKKIKKINEIIRKIFAMEFEDLFYLNFFTKIESIRDKKLLVKRLNSLLKKSIARQAELQSHVAKSFKSPAYHIFYTWFKDKVHDDVISDYSSFFVKTDTMLRFFKKESFVFTDKNNSFLKDKFKSYKENKTLRNLFSDSGFFLLDGKINLEDIVNYYNAESVEGEKYQTFDFVSIFELLRQDTGTIERSTLLKYYNKGIEYFDKKSGTVLIFKLGGLENADITRAHFQPKFIFNVDLDLFNAKE